MPARVVFEKQLSAIHTEGIVQLERQGLATRPDKRAMVLDPLIDVISENLRVFETQIPDEIGEKDTNVTSFSLTQTDGARNVLSTCSEVAGCVLPPLRAPGRS